MTLWTRELSLKYCPLFEEAAFFVESMVSVETVDADGNVTISLL